jgi:hypothetical protein
MSAARVAADFYCTEWPAAWGLARQPARPACNRGSDQAPGQGKGAANGDQGPPVRGSAPGGSTEGANADRRDLFSLSEFC